MEFEAVALQADRPDIAVASVGLSTDTIASFILRFFRSPRLRHVSGEFTSTSRSLRLTLRKADATLGEKQYFEEARSPDDVEVLLQHAARSTLEQFAPFFIASAYYPREQGRASRKLTEIIRTWPYRDETLARAYDLRGLIRYNREQYRDASGDYEAAIALQPRQAFFHVNLAALLKRQGNGRGAISEESIAIQLDPKLAVAHNDLGALEYERKDFSKAALEFTKAIELDPFFAQPHNNLGNILRYRGNDDGAIQEYKAAIRLDRLYAIPHWGLGVVLEEDGNEPGAIHEYRSALKLNPRFPEAYSSLGDALLNTRSVSDASKDYEAAIRLAPTFAAPHYGLANVFMEERQRQAAMREYCIGKRLDRSSNVYKPGGRILSSTC